VFAGEAMLPFVELGSKQMIPYAIDLSATVTKTLKSRTQNYHQIYVKTDIYGYYYAVQECTYKINNFGEFAKKVVVEHPKQEGWELFDTENPAETTNGNYRFVRELPARTAAEFTVEERYVSTAYIQSDSLTREILAEWVRLKLIDEEKRVYLEKLVTLHEQIATNQGVIRDIDTLLGQIAADQRRLRANLDALGKSRAEEGLRSKYIAKLNGQETLIETNEQRKAQLLKENEALRLEIQTHVSG
jgi:hypothetical protein